MHGHLTTLGGLGTGEGEGHPTAQGRLRTGEGGQLQLHSLQLLQNRNYYTTHPCITMS